MLGGVRPKKSNLQFEERRSMLKSPTTRIFAFT